MTGTSLVLLACTTNADEGAQTYAKKCAGCHQAGGAGIPSVFPPINNLGVWLARPDGRQWMADAVVNGPSGEIVIDGKTYNGLMPNYGAHMNDTQIAAVLRYVGETLNAPPQGYKPFTEDLVAAARLVPEDEASMIAIRGKLPPR